MLRFNLPPIKKIKLNLYVVYLLPLLTGLIARAIFYMHWFKSPFHYYHILVGLDMRKFLIYGENFAHGNGLFSPYRLFIAVIYQIVGSNILPEAVVLGQIIMGLCTVSLTVYVALSISGSRNIALFSGLFIALYAPVIIYETQILKASIFLFLSVLSLATLLYARERHFSSISSFLAGVAAILPFFVRHAGFLWLITIMTWIAFYCRIKMVEKCETRMNLRRICLNFKPLLFFFVGSFSVLLAVIAINRTNGVGSRAYFLPNYSYLLSTGADESNDISRKKLSDLVDHKKPSPSRSASKALHKIKHYATKVFYVFNTFEMPNNINYYFVQKKLPVSKFFIGPALLIPLALTGMILMILYGGFYKKESILFFYIAAFAIPICVFLPLGRYKLVLSPIFCITAAYTLIYLYRIVENRGDKLHNILTPCLLTVLFFLTISTVSYPERRDDDKAYGRAASYVPDKLMKKGKFSEASTIMAEYYAKNPDNDIIILNYVSSLLGCGRPKDAEFILNTSGIPENRELAGRYYYELGETYYMLGGRKKALACYREVLKYPCADHRKKLAEKRMNELPR